MRLANQIPAKQLKYPLKGYRNMTSNLPPIHSILRLLARSLRIGLLALCILFISHNPTLAQGIIYVNHVSAATTTAQAGTTPTPTCKTRWRLPQAAATKSGWPRAATSRSRPKIPKM